jgi:hypothetical protein
MTRNSRAENRSNSATDLWEFCALTRPRAAFRQNVWQSGARNSVPKTDEFPVPVMASINGRLMAIPENVWISRNPLEISSDSRLVWSARSLGVSDRRAQAGMADGSNLAVPVTRRLSLAWHQWRVAENSRSFPTFAFSRCADWRRHDGE